MSERHTFLSAFVAELTRRKVPRTVGAYAVTVFVLLQLMDAAVEPLRMPDWLPTLVVVVLILGFPIVFILAWQFDVSAQGIRRTRTAGLLTRSQSSLLFSLMLLLTAGMGFGFLQYFSAVLEAPDAAQEPASGQARDFVAPENSIAVLPFADLSAEGDQQYLSDGIAEEILNLLAQVHGLHVAARTSSFAFRDRQSDIREIGRLLNVRTVLEGSIRSAGNRVRLTAQLINVEDGFHIWSQSYDREMDDLFALQDEIASQIATSLVESFGGLAPAANRRADNLAAANAYRTGRLHWWRRTPRELERAIGLFAEALEHDPAFAPAYAGLADTWMLLAEYGNVTPMEAADRAGPMVEKALALDPESAEGFAALGLIRWRIGQRDAAESALRRAMELNENYIPAQLWLGGILHELGRYPEEHLVLKAAMARDPLNELLVANYSSNLAMRGEVDQAREVLRDLVEVRPDSTMLLRHLAFHELDHGGLVEGWKLADRVYQLGRNNPVDYEILAKAWLMLDQPERADALLAEALERAGQNAMLLNIRSLVLLVEGRFEEAEAKVREQMAGAGEDIPEPLRRSFQLRLGMMALLREDLPTARSLLAEAAGGADDAAYDGDRLLAQTLAAVAAARVGDGMAAAAYLEEADRQVQRARINGVDHPQMYYSEAAVLALKGDPAAAVERLQQAYDRGFRELWLIDLDGRLDTLRQRPEFVAIKARIREDIDRALAEVRALQHAA